MFKNKIVRVENAPISDVVGEILTEVKHVVLHKERVLAKKKRQNELFERLERTSPGRRAPIPEEVRMFVWRRDRGQCVKCGSNEKLEFDHIIPLTEGGSSTERNLQILCESCNREKGRTI